MQHLRKDILSERDSQNAQSRPHGAETVRMQRVRQVVRHETAAPSAFSPSHRRKTFQMRTLRRTIHPPAVDVDAFEETFGRAAAEPGAISRDGNANEARNRGLSLTNLTLKRS